MKCQRIFPLSSWRFDNESHAVTRNARDPKALFIRPDRGQIRLQRRYFLNIHVKFDAGNLHTAAYESLQRESSIYAKNMKRMILLKYLKI